MSLLSFFIIIGSIIFGLFGIDLFKRKKATLLHFIVFVGGAGLLLIFGIFPTILQKFGELFGVARGADVIVYGAIVALLYRYISLYNAHLKEKQTLTKLISRLASDEFVQQYREYSDEQKQTINTTKRSAYVFLIRVYNEGEMVGSVIDDVYNHGYRKILCVDDGSVDNSRTIIEQKRIQYPDCLVIIVSHPINRGSGAANCTGFATLKKYAPLIQSERIVMIDGDGQMNLEDMKTFHNRIIEDKGEYLMYFGSRFLEESVTTNMPMMRKAVVRLGKIFTRMLYGIDVSDHHCGFRVMHQKTINTITIQADNRHYANEIAEQVHIHHIPFAEVPVHIRYTDYSMGKGHGQRSINSIFIGLQMLYQKFFFR